MMLAYYFLVGKSEAVLGLSSLFMTMWWVFGFSDPLPFLLIHPLTRYTMDHDEHMGLPHVKHHINIDSLYSIYTNVRGDARLNLLRGVMKQVKEEASAKKN